MIDPAYPDSDEDFEAVYAALFELTAGIRWGDEQQHKFLTRSRRVKLFNEVPAEAQPAIFQAEHDEDEAPRTGGIGKRILGATWFVYWAVGGEPTAVPTITANRIMGGLRRALRPITADPGFHDRRQTLGGLAYTVRIEGKVFKDPGDLDGQGLLVVPIKIIMP